LFDGTGVNSTQITAITSNSTWKKVVANLGEAYAKTFQQEFPSATIGCVYVGQLGAAAYCYDLRSFGSYLKTGVSPTYTGTQGTLATCPTSACTRRLQEGDPEDDDVAVLRSLYTIGSSTTFNITVAGTAPNGTYFGSATVTSTQINFTDPSNLSQADYEITTPVATTVALGYTPSPTPAPTPAPTPTPTNYVCTLADIGNCSNVSGCSNGSNSSNWSSTCAEIYNGTAWVTYSR
jgi:hypothetical protein